MRLHGSMSILGAALLVLLAGCPHCVSADTGTLAPLEVSQYNGTLYAACKMRPSSSLPDGLPKVSGVVLFKQDYPQGELKVLFRFNGFPKPSLSRAMHIHQYGDLSGGCGSTGGHYNPHAVNHPGHPGDFGNFDPQEGRVRMMASEATLFSGQSVIGRAVVVHEKTDDLGLGGDPGSLLHGNAGQRLGCCIIGISSPTLWNINYKKYMRQPFNSDI
ncbi:extracellular superoxide dismutase [Cu-Zn]-like [Cottoperca gobio]|uniref:Superoxide dismutase [Cu-Zn] n=1 Tax=Cottoperca gobio TaxID=56716 RepID=A0A6J2QNQ7_COTGO|nr:extracellular superoxide dismutase [Cu-Zn] [Cottoperca gobio]